jgi:hypothetical protein
MFEFLSKSRASDQFKARSPDRDAATDRARVAAILDSIKDALSAATVEHTGLKTRIEDVLARAAVTVGNDTDEYLTRGNRGYPVPKSAGAGDRQWATPIRRA